MIPREMLILLGSGDFTDVGNGVSFVESHDFTAIHGSNIIIDETAARCVSIKRQRVCEPDSGSGSLPECIRYFVDDFAMTETTSSNNVGPVDLSSLGGCLPDANVTELSAAKQKLMLLDNAAEVRLMLLSHINAANVILMLSRQS
nr:hypothetical protein [Tanacetum cinerariifolium]